MCVYHQNVSRLRGSEVPVLSLNGMETSLRKLLWPGFEKKALTSVLAYVAQSCGISSFIFFEDTGIKVFFLHIVLSFFSKLVNKLQLN